MSLKTYSAFIYGHNITEDNSFIDFSENGIDELYAQVEVGSYTLTDFLNKVLSALNFAGDLEYSGSINRSTRKITISASGNFELRVDGSHSAISAFELLGFTSNKTGSNSYESDIPSGFIYEPQYKLQSFVDFIDNVQIAESSVSTSASGIVEVVSYGQNEFMECNITFITDIIGQGIIKNNPNGVADLRKFMNYCIRKRPVEFMADIDAPEIFTPCILEGTKAESKGTGFQLYELYSRGLANYFETGIITFRAI